MSARRGQTDLSGILLVDKPSGMTSHDVVNRVRRATGEKRVGHAGTLDPMATGLLVVLVGPAARLEPFLSSAEKTYDARIVFGSETDTDDADGRVTARAAVPDEICDPFAAGAIVAALVGTHQQIPPAYSAIKREGVVAYQAARDGAALDLAPRTIEIAAARLVGVDCDRESAWDMEVTVSKGTYIRAIARDLGRALHTAAHLGALRRSRSGAADAAASHKLAQVESADDLSALFADPIKLLGLSAIEVGVDDAARVRNGANLDAATSGAGESEPSEGIAITHLGVLLGVYARCGTLLKPRVIIPGGVRGGR